MKSFYFLSVLILFTHQSLALGSNIFLSEPIKTKVCDELISEMVEDITSYNEMMSVCLDSEKTTFCTPSLDSETTAVSERGFILYNIVNFKPTEDTEKTSYSVKAYPDSGLFLRQKTSHTSCN